MRSLIFNCLFILILLSCRQKQHGETKNMDFDAFSIETPLTWKKVNRKGIDSYVGAIAIDSIDTLKFDMGSYSNTLNEFAPLILDSSMISDAGTNDISEIIFVKDHYRVDPDRYKYNNVSWDTIDNRLAKLVYPRRSGKGTTGVYIDSVWISRGDVVRFNLYGIDLHPANEKTVFEAIKTIKFKGKSNDKKN